MATERRARTERNVVLALGAVLVFLAGLYFLLQRANRLSPQMLASSLFLFALAMVNVVLVLVLLFVLFRNLIKLLVERRRGVLGSRFRTKMVFTFAAMTLLPSMVLFAAALYLIQLSVERWFSTPVDEITRLSQEIVDSFHASVKEGVRADAEDLAVAIRAGRLLDLDRASTLRAEMLAAIAVRHLDRIEVHTRTDPPLDVGSEPRTGERPGAIPEGLLNGALEGSSFQWMERMDRGFLVRAGAPIHSTFNQDVVGGVVEGARVRIDRAAVEEQQHPTVGVFVDLHVEDRPDLDVHAELLADLPGEARLRSLSRLELSSGELPVAGHEAAGWAARDEERAVVPGDETRGNDQEGKGAGRIGHVTRSPARPARAP